MSASQPQQPPPPSRPKHAGFSSAISTFFHSIQSRQWLVLQRKAQKLDPTTQSQLRDFLHDHVGGGGGGKPDNDDNNNCDEEDTIIPDDYEILQKELDRAYGRQEELEEKKAFVITRLETYQAKVRELEQSLLQSSTSSSSDTDTEQRIRQQQTKIDKLKEALLPVQQSCTNMEIELKKLHRQISSLHQRQMELKMKTQECKAVLEELDYTATQMQSMNLKKDDDDLEESAEEIEDDTQPTEEAQVGRAESWEIEQGEPKHQE